MTTTEPQVGRKARALTTTTTEQSVVIEVSAIESEQEGGWYVWGYRQGGRNCGRRQTMIPRLYFVPRVSQ